MKINGEIYYVYGLEEFIVVIFQFSPNQSKIGVWGRRNSLSLKSPYCSQPFIFSAIEHEQTSSMQYASVGQVDIEDNNCPVEKPIFKLQFHHFLANQSLTSQLFTHKLVRIPTIISKGSYINEW